MLTFLDAFLQSQSCKFSRDFTNAKEQLKAKKAHFEAEARLADVQHQAKRHQEILTKFDMLPRDPVKEPITIGLAGRNVMFTGRDDVLMQLHSILSLDTGDSLAKHRRSCLIHGLGGMGKSQTALEYSYRYRSSYSHICWLRAESDTTLKESFLAIVRKLELSPQDATVDMKLENCLRWLESEGTFKFCIPRTKHVLIVIPKVAIGF